MDALSYTAARARLAEMMKRVCDDHAPVMITRQNERTVVMLSLEDYEAIEETAYLLRSPANAARLAKSLDQAAKGKLVKGKLAEK
jgi:antitoxin YefM